MSLLFAVGRRCPYARGYYTCCLPSTLVVSLVTVVSVSVGRVSEVDIIVIDIIFSLIIS